MRGDHTRTAGCTRTIRRRTLVAGAILTVGALALGGCTQGAVDTDQTSRSVDVLLDWTPNPDHLALYTAQAAGYYDEAGVDVTFTTPSGTADAAKMVSLGQTDLAVSYEPDTLIAESEGLDVVSVAALVPRSITSLMTWSGSGISGPEDLAGHTVGTSGLASQETTVDWIARQHGVDPDTISYVNLSQGLNQPLIDHQVDATFGAYPNIEGVELAEHGDFPSFTATEMGVPDYAELVVIAQRSRLDDDADYAQRVRDFLAATARGQQDAKNDPQTAVAALREPTAGAYTDEQLRTMVERTVPLTVNDRGFGRQDTADWATYANWMRDNGLLEQDVDGASGHTNDLLPEV
jgi:putative hydroxymethylpyrimidine transport system substrate-binding protein